MNIGQVRQAVSGFMLALGLVAWLQGAAGSDPKSTMIQHIFAQLPPPRVGPGRTRKEYNYTDFATNNAQKLVQSGPKVPYGRYYRVWANFCSPPISGSRPNDDTGCIGGNRAKQAKGNYLNYPTIRTSNGSNRFSNYELANNCSLAQTAFALGSLSARIAATWGQHLAIVWDPAKWTVPAASFHDICIMPQESVPFVDGILVDYEPGDGRTAAQTERLVRDLAQLVHAKHKKIILYGHPLTRSRHDGIDPSNAAKLSAIVDYLTVDAWANEDYSGFASMSGSLEAQLQVLDGDKPTAGADRTHLMVSFDLGGTSLADAVVVRNFMLANQIGAVIFWKDTKRSRDGIDADAKVACLVKGRC